MPDLLEKKESLVENFRTLEGLLQTYGPDELHAIRKRALEEFERLGIPTTKHEEWKYTSLRVLEETRFKPAYGANVFREDLERAPLGKLESIRLTFVNGEFAPELSTQQTLPKGVTISTLKEALESESELVLQHLAKHAGVTEGRLGADNEQPFVQLNTAFLGEGAFIHLAKGATVEELVHISFVNQADHGPFVAHPRVLIVAEENAEVKVLESHLGLTGQYFTNGVTEVVVGKNANVEHTKVQLDTPEAIHIAAVQAWQEEGSVLTSNNASFGARLCRNDIQTYLNGEHTESWLNGTYVGIGEQVTDNHTRIDHAKANCNSFEVYKGILGDRAVGVFNGKIFVYEDAQKTDAKQTNQAILLSPTATINTKPQLEIFADDVKCTHGATVGQLREDALFYLRARGIPLQEAKALLVYAFAAEVLEKISDEDVRNAVEKLLFDKLNEGGQLPDDVEA